MVHTLLGLSHLLVAHRDYGPYLCDVGCMLCFLGTTVAVEGGDILHHMLFKLREPLVQTLQVGFDPCSPLLDHLVVLRALLSPHVLPRITELLGNLLLVFCSWCWAATASRLSSAHWLWYLVVMALPPLVLYHIDEEGTLLTHPPKGL